MNFFNSGRFFLFILVLYLLFYAWNNRAAGPEDLSSDLLIYQMVMVQEQEHPWSYLPSAYNREDPYFAYPLFYHLNPGLERGLATYHALMVLIITSTYLASGFVLWRITGSWIFATLGALMILVPHNVGFTTTGLSSVGDLRGNVLVFPFYLLVSYYWLIEGTKKPALNLLLAILAGALVYLYPVASIVSVFVFSLTGLVVFGRKRLKPLFVFWVVYLVLVAPFMYAHFSNPAAQMTAAKESLTPAQLQEYSTIIQHRFRANGFLSSVDLARIKRTIWDTTPLLVLLIAGWAWFPRVKSSLSERETLAHKISLVSFLVIIVWVVVIDLINTWSISHGQPPIFIEHIRSLRLLGFILTVEAVLVLAVLFRSKSRLATALISLVLVFSPIHFSAPLIRPVVRTFVPEPIRLKYNLAPVVSMAETLEFKNVLAAARWARDNLPDAAKVFVFSGDQHDFAFKFFSRKNTNLTAKEGSIWVTSNFADAKAWYEERKRYEEIVQREDFVDIVGFARSLGSGYLLLPAGELHELHLTSGLDLPIEYSNEDYQILKL